MGRIWRLVALTAILATGACSPTCGTPGRTSPMAARPSAVAERPPSSVPQPTPAGPPPAPAARSGAAAAYDGAHDELVLFGGTAADGAGLNDTWTFDGQRWSQHGLPVYPPGGGAGQMTFDGASGKVLLFAGEDQTWTWDGDQWTHEHPAHQPPRPGPLAYDPSVGIAVLLSMTTEQGTHTWGWNGSDWYPINESVPDPGVLEGLAYDVRGARLLGLGGNATWAFIGSRWSRLADLPDGLPVANVAAASSAVVNAPVVFGGGIDNSDLSGDLWAWDGKSWKRVDAPGGPQPRRSAVLGDDQKRNQLVVFGGIGAGGVLGDTWTWSPDKGWNQVG